MLTKAMVHDDTDKRTKNRDIENTMIEMNKASWKTHSRTVSVSLDDLESIERVAMPDNRMNKDCIRIPSKKTSQNVKQMCKHGMEFVPINSSKNLLERIGNVWNELEMHEELDSGKVMICL